MRGLEEVMCDFVFFFNSESLCKRKALTEIIINKARLNVRSLGCSTKVV